MSATEYDVNIKDILFILFEQLGLEDVLKLDHYSHVEANDAKMIIDQAAAFAKGVMAPLNRPGDEEGVHFNNGVVTTPKGFKELYRQYAEGGWIAMTGSMEYDGQQMPKMLSMAASDIFTGANCSFSLYNMLTIGAAHVIEHWCDEATKQKYLPNMYSGKWTGSMMLTEPQAGSDLGIVKTMATPVPGEDYYLIQGSKLFITAGDQDLSENIVHMVLARLPDAPPGTKGISLFIVPKFRLDAAGATTAESNDVAVVRIEHKHGIMASATCQMALGDNNQCRGWLVGEPHSGIKIMFQMMNEARIEVGVQGMTHANSAYLSSLAFSQERLQGQKLTEKDPAGKRVPIIEHPDIRRMLLHMKAYGEGMRAFIYSSAKNADLAARHPDPAVREHHQNMLELITPICKAYGSDYGVEVAGMGIQIYGGVGYTREYPVEQMSRDVRIATIYEGANGIQALDLFGRKLTMKKGALYQSFIKEMGQFTAQVKDHPTLHAYAAQLDEHAALLTATVMQFGKAAMTGNLEGAATWAVPFLHCMGDVVMAYHHLQQAVIATKKLNEKLASAGVDAADTAAVAALVATSDEAAFYAGKLDNVAYWYRFIMPQSKAKLATLGSCDTIAVNAVLR